MACLLDRYLLDRSRIPATALVAIAVLSAGATLGSPALTVPPDGEVLGWVLTPGNEPLAGATVALRALPTRYDLYQRMLSGEGPRPPVSTVETDARGRYRMPWLPTLKAALFEVHVHKAGSLAAVFSPLPPTATRTLPPLRLVPDHGVRARITTENRSVPDLDVSGPLWVLARSLEGAPDFGAGWRPAARHARLDNRAMVRLPRAEKERLEIQLAAPGAALLGRADGIRTVHLALAETETVARQLRVIRSTGRPAAGVIVVAARASVPLGMTGEDGTLEILVPRKRGILMLELLAADGSTWRHAVPLAMPFSVPRNEANAALLSAAWTVELAPEAVVGGRVVAADGAAVVGAWVFSEADPGRLFRTDAAGRWAAASPGAGATSWQIHQPGFATRLVTFGRGDPLARPAIALQSAVSVRGRVVDAEGRGIEGVMLTARHGSQLSLVPDPATARALSGEDGHFVLADLPRSRRYRLEVRHARFVPLERMAAPAESLPDLVLMPRRRGYGQVVDREDRPIEGARLEIASAGLPARSIVAETDAEGRWQVPFLPGENLSLRASAAGFAPFTVRGIEPHAAPFAVDLGVVVLKPGQTLAGRVIDSAGEPIEAAAVVLTSVHLDRSPESITDTEGRFRITDLTSAPVSLRVASEGYVTTRLAAVPVPNDRPVTVRLARAMSMGGWVVDASGEPVAGAQVTLLGRGQDAGRIEAQGHASEIHRVMHSLADGRFAFDNLPPGAVEVMASAMGYQTTTAMPLDLEPATQATGIELVLVPGLRVHGTVRTVSGRPVQEAKMAVDDRLTVTDAEGHFVLDGLSTGPAELMFWNRRADRKVWPIEVVDDMAPLELEVPDGLEISGYVVDAGERPVVGASLRILAVHRGDHRVAEALSDEDGRFTTGGFAAGIYRLVADHPEHGRGSLEVDLDRDGFSGIGADLRLVLAVPASLSGSLVGLDAEEVATVEVTARHPELGAIAGKVDYAGSYRIDRLAPGPWHVIAKVVQGNRQAETRVLVFAADEIRRDLFFEGSTLTGVARFLGEPIQAARIGLRGLDHTTERRAMTDPEGQFQITDLAPGRYRISVVSRRAAVSYHRDVELVGDRYIDLDVEPVALEGSVTDLEGKPLPGAGLRLEHQPRLGPSGSVIALAADKQGLFHIAHVPPGPHRLRVRHPGHEPLEQDLELGTVPVESLDLRLRPAPGLRLRLLVPASSRVRYATVAMLDAAGGVIRLEAQRLDAAGEARFNSLPSGELDLLVRVPGTVARRLRATVPGPPVEVELTPAAKVEVWVPELAESDRVAWVTVRSLDGVPFATLDDSGLWRQSWPVASGRALVDGLPLGPWALQVETSDGRVWRGSVALAAGGRQKLSL